MSLAQPRILVADNQPDVVEALRLLLKANGFGVVPASSPAGVLGAVGDRGRRRGPHGPQLRARHHVRQRRARAPRRAARARPDAPVVVMTAWGSVEGAVEAMRRGARDYVQKPWDNARLVATLRTQVELGARAAHGKRLAAENAARARSRELPALVARVARDAAGAASWSSASRRSDANVLDHRRARHRQGGRRARAPRCVAARGARRSSPVNAGGARRGRVRERAVRPREGRVHRREADRDGCFELGRRRHAVPRRDRRTCRSASRRSCCACCRPASSSPVGSSRPRAPTCACSPRPTPTSRAR